MQTKYNNTFTMVNLLLGAGPIILPYAFFKGGILLSSIWMLIISFISYITAMYIAQSIQNVKQIQSQQPIKSDLLTEQTQKLSNNLIISTQNHQQKNVQEKEQLKPKKYDHIQLFTCLYKKHLRVFPALSVSIYLLGTAISKCIMTGNVLAKVFKDIQVLNNFYLWLGLFFISGAAFSFKSIASTKVLQLLIVVVRFISIFLMLGGSLFMIIKNGTKDPIPSGQSYFNVNNFAQIFSNTLFSLMCHHSLPGIAQQSPKLKDTRFFIKLSFLISCLTLFIIPLTACFAFGQNLGKYTYKYYNFNFQEEAPFIYYFVSFYVFLNVAAFSVYIIVIRTNILKIIKPQIDSMKVSKQTIGYTAILLLLILSVSILLQDKIQTVFNFTGGIFGSLVLFFIPSLQVYSSRKKLNKEESKKNILKKYFPFVIIIVGGFLMVFNLQQIILKLIK